MSAGPIAGLALAALWLAAACALPFLRAPNRPRAFWALVAAGVPLAGWMTLRWGPGPGVLSVGLAVLILLRPPLHPRHHLRTWPALRPGLQSGLKPAGEPGTDPNPPRPAP